MCSSSCLRAAFTRLLFDVHTSSSPAPARRPFRGMCRGPPNAASPRSALWADVQRGIQSVRLDVHSPFGRLPALRAQRVWRPLTPRIAMASLRFSLSPRVRALVSGYLALPACRKSTADLLAAANHAGTESRHHPPHRHNGIFGPPDAAAPPAPRASASRPNRGPVHW
jgi:hypothetical protein